MLRAPSLKFLGLRLRLCSSDPTTSPSAVALAFRGEELLASAEPRHADASRGRSQKTHSGTHESPRRAQLRRRTIRVDPPNPCNPCPKALLSPPRRRQTSPHRTQGVIPG